MFEIKNLSDIPNAAVFLINELKNYSIWLFEGEMGVGKTTLIKEICKQLGVRDSVSSPTFSLVNEYEGENRIIYHFDFYKINIEEEALDIGVNEYFESGNLCLVEWPSKIQNILPAEIIFIYLYLNSDISRTIKIIKHV